MDPEICDKGLLSMCNSWGSQGKCRKVPGPSRDVMSISCKRALRCASWSERGTAAGGRIGKIKEDQQGVLARPVSAAHLPGFFFPFLCYIKRTGSWRPHRVAHTMSITLRAMRRGFLSLELPARGAQWFWPVKGKLWVFVLSFSCFIALRYIPV